MTHIRQRVDTQANWTAANPVLMLGEIGWNSDTNQAKRGDGATAWNSLPYATVSLAALTAVENDVADLAGDVASLASSVSGKADLASPTFTGFPRAPTVTNVGTYIATTGFVTTRGYAPLSSPALTGTPTSVTPAVGDNSTRIATTAFVKNQAYATLASPTFTGTPAAPTASPGSTNTTQIATTAFVQAAIALDKTNNDTGWVAITANTANNWAIGSPAPQYRVKNGLCYLRGNLSRSSGSNTAPFTLPAGARPVTNTHAVIARYSVSPFIIVFAIPTNGVAAIGSSYANGETVQLDMIPPFHTT